MDNATRRQILEKVKQLGYPDTIEALRNPQVLDQYEQQLQTQSQQQQQPIQQQPTNFPTPPVTTPNYKVPQPIQSEAKPLVMSFNETTPQLMKTGGIKFDKGGPKDKGWREFKTPTGQSLFLDPRFKDQRYYVDEQGNMANPNQNLSLYDVNSGVWEAGTSMPTLEIKPRYRYEKRPGALGSFETVRIDDDNGSREIISPNPMETRREQEKFVNSFNPAAMATEGLVNIGQGNIGEGLLQVGLTMPIATPLKVAGKNVPKNTEELIDLYRIQEKGAKTFKQLAEEGKVHPLLNNAKTIAKKAEEEKYFGQWFTKDKADLDWYAKDREFIDPEIINLRVPKSKLEQYSNYDKSLSRAADREFIVPIEEQSLYRHTGIPNKKYGGLKFEDGGFFTDPPPKKVEPTLPVMQAQALSTAVNPTGAEIFARDNALQIAQNLNALPENPPAYYPSDAYISGLRLQENAGKSGFNKNNNKWYSHASVEGGTNTIAYGHKLTKEEAAKGIYSKGITEQQANELLKKDLEHHLNNAKKVFNSKYGENAFDKVPNELKDVLVDYSYNGVLNKFNNFTQGVYNYSTAATPEQKELAHQQMLKEYQRKAGDKLLTGRNTWTKGMLESVPTRKYGGKKCYTCNSSKMKVLYNKANYKK
jgi:hypothetical protein